MRKVGSEACSAAAEYYVAYDVTVYVTSHLTQQHNILPNTSAEYSAAREAPANFWMRQIRTGIQHTVYSLYINYGSASCGWPICKYHQ